MSAPADLAPISTSGLLASIDEPPLASLLARLHDAGPMAVSLTRSPERRPAPLPLSAAQGRFLYLIARAIRARSVVELNTTAGIATLYLAAALLSLIHI